MLDNVRDELGGPPAGFWPRFGAALIDGILLGVVNSILRVVLHRRPRQPGTADRLRPGIRALAAGSLPIHVES